MVEKGAQRKRPARAGKPSIAWDRLIALSVILTTVLASYMLSGVREKEEEQAMLCSQDLIYLKTRIDNFQNTSYSDTQKIDEEFKRLNDDIFSLWKRCSGYQVELNSDKKLGELWERLRNCYTKKHRELY